MSSTLICLLIKGTYFPNHPRIILLIFVLNISVFSVSCEPKEPNKTTTLTISWSLGEVSCWKDYLHVNEEVSLKLIS